MRFDVHYLEELKTAVEQCDDGDRIVIFFLNHRPVRLTIRMDHRPGGDLLRHPCNLDGDPDFDKHKTSQTSSPTAGGGGKHRNRDWSRGENTLPDRHLGAVRDE